MILDKIKELHKVLAHLEKKDRNVIGISHPMDMNLVKQSILKGKWAILFFEASTTKTATRGLRVMPHLPGENWPVVDTMPYMESFIQSPNMAMGLIDRKILALNEVRSYCDKYLNEWDTIYKLVQPLYCMFGGRDEMKLLKDFVFDSSQWPNEDISENELKPRIKKALLQFDPSTEHKMLIDLVDKLKSDEEFIPDIPTVDLGIYEDRFKSMIAMRSYISSSDIDMHRIESNLLSACQYTHGFGTEDISPRYRSGANETALHVFDPIGRLCADYNVNKLSSTLKAIPEYQIAIAMFEQRKGYKGIKHLELAALMDESGEPLKAWTYLVSAGYWAGRNLPEAQIKILNAAIELCQRQKWVEAEEVLLHNLSILQTP